LSAAKINKNNKTDAAYEAKNEIIKPETNTGKTCEAEARNEIATEIIIAIKKSYTQTITAVTPLLSRYANMRIHLVEDVYPAGDEIILIYESTGVVIPPGTLPSDSGLLVLNVETVYNIYRAVYKDAPVIHKWVTVTGEVRRPATLLLAVGSTVREAVETAGGITTSITNRGITNRDSIDSKAARSSRNAVIDMDLNVTAASSSPFDEPAYLIGGPMMGYLAASGDEKIKKTTNAVIVLPQDHFLVQTYSHNPKTDLNRVASACCQCRVCTDMCPRKMLGYPIEPHRIMRALAMRDSDDVTALSGALYCSLCGVCERVACPQGLAPRALLRMYKSSLSKHGVRPQVCKAGAIDADRDYRQCDEARLTVKLGLAKYQHDAPMIDEGHQ
jgi:Na+-translocating ferredoxin:NAD+ oxidoreductase RnfC subunit